MQAVTSCSTTPTTLTDARDGQTYQVAKLKDGKCWMTTNLRLGSTTLTTDLTSANTNLSTTISASTFNGWKKTSGTATYTASEYMTVSGNDNSSGGPGTPYGVLYNYCAASAGTICATYNLSNASYDICPKGWRLPTGGGSGEFQALYTQYGSAANMRKSVASGGAAFALAGVFGTGSPEYQGDYGYYWASTNTFNTHMDRLYLDVQNVDATDGYYRRYGNSIRCVLK